MSTSKLSLHVLAEVSQVKLIIKDASIFLLIFKIYMQVTYDVNYQVVFDSYSSIYLWILKQIFISIYLLCFRQFDEPWEMAREKQDEIHNSLY